MTREPSRIGSQRPRWVWTGLFAICTAISMLGWAYFEASENFNPAMLVYLTGQVLAGVLGAAFVGFYSGSRHKNTLRAKARVAHARLVRRRLLLLPLAQIPLMVLLTPIAFHTIPGDRSIFAAIGGFAAFGVGGVLLGTWLGKKIVVPAADFVWDPPKHGTTGGRIDRVAVLLLLGSGVLSAHIFTLMAAVTPPGQRSNYWVCVPSLIGLHVPGVTEILHPTVLWISRALLVATVAVWARLCPPEALLTARARRRNKLDRPGEETSTRYTKSGT